VTQLGGVMTLQAPQLQGLAVGVSTLNTTAVWFAVKFAGQVG
jgi:hypothetical protein